MCKDSDFCMRKSTFFFIFAKKILRLSHDLGQAAVKFAHEFIFKH